MEWARETVQGGAIGVNRICELIGISKATYYACRDPQERFSEKHTNIKKHVRGIIKKNKCYGVKRIKDALWQEKGVAIGRDALGKLLKLWELSLPRKIKKRCPSLAQKILEGLADRVNLLVRSPITEPFQALTSDISDILYQRGKSKAYLCIHKDVFGQLVYGYTLGTTKEASLVRQSLKKALKKIRKFTGRIRREMIIHQDQGSQYTSYGYIEDVLAVSTISYSTKGTPTDNPGQESFFGRFKDEWEDEMLELETFEELKRFIQNKIHYYNTKRLHTSIGNQTPLKFTKEFLKNRGKRFSKPRD